MPPDSGTVIPDRAGAKGPGWWAKLDPRRKRLFMAAAIGGVLAVIYLLTRSSPTATAADVPTDTTDTSMDGSQTTGVPGAWDYGGTPSPYPNFPPPGHHGGSGKLSWQLTQLRKQLADLLAKQKIHPTPHFHKPPRRHHKPPRHHHGHHQGHGGGRGGHGQHHHGR